MRHTFALLAAGAAIGLPQVALALEANEIFKRADPSIVVVTISDKSGKEVAQGSGVIIAPRDLVTSCHVLTKGVGISVKQGDVIRSGKLRYQDTARDLCQVQLDDVFPAGKPVSGLVKSSDLEVGQSVYAIGAPRGLERTISRGIVSGLRDSKDGSKLVQTDASISPGSSGGGLFDSEARLMGIVTFGLVQENLNFAIPADWILQLPERNRDRTSDMNPVTTNAVAVQGAPALGWMPKPGDRWKYRHSYGRQVTGVVTIEIMSVSGSAINERVTFDRSRSFMQLRDIYPQFASDRFQKLVVLPGGYQLAEINPYMPPDAELSPGKIWRDISGEFSVQGASRRTLISEMRVIGRETIEVPAGTFNAWRIETISSRLDQNSVSFNVRCIYWHAPEMQRAVRIQIVTESPVAVLTNTETYDLAVLEKQ
jgi:serine protease Do